MNPRFMMPVHRGCIREDMLVTVWTAGYLKKESTAYNT